MFADLCEHQSLRVWRPPGGQRRPKLSVVGVTLHADERPEEGSVATRQLGSDDTCVWQEVRVASGQHQGCGNIPYSGSSVTVKFRKAYGALRPRQRLSRQRSCRPTFLRPPRRANLLDASARSCLRRGAGCGHQGRHRSTLESLACREGVEFDSTRLFNRR